jgi:hypothetical protein
MSEERVYVEIRTCDTAWSIITSRELAEEFIEEWKTSDGEKILEISGVCDHRDANQIEVHIEKEAIVGVYVQELKL